MNIENLIIEGQGFQLPASNCAASLNGIWFNDASGLVSGVTVENMWQTQGDFPSCQAGKGIRADGDGTARKVTVTGTTVENYQKNGIQGCGTMTLDVTSSTMGPAHPLDGLVAQNGLVYSSFTTTGFSAPPSGAASGNTIYGSGDRKQDPGGPIGSVDGTSVDIFGAQDVTITDNVMKSSPLTTGTDIGVFLEPDAPSTGIDISFNTITRAGGDTPDLTGYGIYVGPSTATLECNTFSGWKKDIVGAIQMSCTMLPDGAECHPYSANIFTVYGGTTPFTWSVESGSFPPGLTMTPSDGAITGTPTKAGTFTFTVKVADSSSPPFTATQSQTVVIAPDCAPTTTTTIAASTTTTTAATTTTTTTAPTSTAPEAPITSAAVPVTG
jgi:hypothetical protein